MNRNCSIALVSCWLLAATGIGMAQTELALHSFPSPPKGSTPFAGVVEDSAGNLYGTTADGGSGGAGVVYKISPGGMVFVLRSFTGGVDGETPLAGVTLDSAGNLYGTTFGGGTANHGVVYKLDADGNETVLHTFSGGADGGSPHSSLRLDTAGNLYGTAEQGGSANLGVVFKLDKTGRETVLHSFLGGTDGEEPAGDLAMDRAENIYGTTAIGGADFGGVVYEVTAAGTEKVLYSFKNAEDGGSPTGGVLRDSGGNLYGTTSFGGANFAGVVFRLTATGNEKVLYNFTGGLDGGQPQAGVVGDFDGNLYGTTEVGGSAGEGVVFELDPQGNETVLYSFPGGVGGEQPYAGLFRNASGNLYGTTMTGGEGYGLVYEVSPAGSENVVFRFPGVADGFAPFSALMRDSAGNLYGTTDSGGSTGNGTVYEVSATGSEAVLYSFQGGADGAYPYAGGVVRDSAGNLYGTTYSGGADNQGTVYKLSSDGVEQVLHTFTGGADGGNVFSGVTLDSEGNLYGTAYSGGANYGGVVYKLSAAGVEMVLHNFTAGPDGGGPFAGVILDKEGNVYGTTEFGGIGAGVVYKVDSAGNETVLYAFTGGVDGDAPASPLTLDEAGNLYGTTSGGGSGFGVVFKLDTSGSETVLYTFTGGDDGAYPFYSGVIRGSNGVLYGTTQSGGTSNDGVVYAVHPDSGTETVLWSFDFTDGANPLAGVIRGGEGSLFGSGAGGGSQGSGVVFEINP